MCLWNLPGEVNNKKREFYEQDENVISNGLLESIEMMENDFHFDSWESFMNSPYSPQFSISFIAFTTFTDLIFIHLFQFHSTLYYIVCWKKELKFSPWNDPVIKLKS